MSHRSTAQLTRAALIAAMYIILTTIPPFNAVSYGAIQFRLGEALVLLPFLMDEAVVGVAVGCLVANMFSPFGLIDLIVGTSVTLAAALLTRELRRTGRLWLAALPPIILNALIVPVYVSALALPTASSLELAQSLAASMRFVATHLTPGVYVPVALTVLAGEAAVVILVGLPVLALVRRNMSSVKEAS